MTGLIHCKQKEYPSAPHALGTSVLGLGGNFEAQYKDLGDEPTTNNRQISKATNITKMIQGKKYIKIQETNTSRWHPFF